MAKGITAYDGTTTDHGFGPGVTFNVNAQTGDAEFVGSIQASTIEASAAYDSGGGVIWNANGLVAVVSDVATYRVGQTSPEGDNYSVPSDDQVWHLVVGAIGGAVQTPSFTLSQALTVQVTLAHRSYTGSTYSFNVAAAIFSGSSIVAQGPINTVDANESNCLLYCIANLAAGTYTAGWIVESIGTLNLLYWDVIAIDVLRFGN